MAKVKIGANSGDGSRLFQAIVWFADIPASVPANQKPQGVKDAILWFDRKYARTIHFLREDYGYHFEYASEDDRLALANIASRAGLTMTKVA